MGAGEMSGNVYKVDTYRTPKVEDNNVRKAGGAGAARKPKNTVICPDGTGNPGGKVRGTNVWKTFECVDRKRLLLEPSIPEQIAFHDDGVGNERFELLKLITGARRERHATAGPVGRTRLLSAVEAFPRGPRTEE
jgi:uncharacterized protein (DUF2235 family)